MVIALKATTRKERDMVMREFVVFRFVVSESSRPNEKTRHAD